MSLVSTTNERQERKKTDETKDCFMETRIVFWKQKRKHVCNCDPYCSLESIQLLFAWAQKILKCTSSEFRFLHHCNKGWLSQCYQHAIWGCGQVQNNYHQLCTCTPLWLTDLKEISSWVMMAALVQPNSLITVVTPSTAQDSEGTVRKKEEKHCRSLSASEEEAYETWSGDMMGVKLRVIFFTVKCRSAWNFSSLAIGKIYQLYI